MKKVGHLPFTCLDKDAGEEYAKPRGFNRIHMQGEDENIRNSVGMVALIQTANKVSRIAIMENCRSIIANSRYIRRAPEWNFATDNPNEIIKEVFEGRYTKPIPYPKEKVSISLRETARAFERYRASLENLMASTISLVDKASRTTSIINMSLWRKTQARTQKIRKEKVDELSKTLLAFGS